MKLTIKVIGVNLEIYQSGTEVLKKRDIEERERDSGTSVGKAGHVPPKSGWLTPM